MRYYLENNRGLKDKFGYNYTAVYEYFLTKGKYVTDEFSPIFNCKYYMENNQDLKKHLGENRDFMMDHFIKFGMSRIIIR